MRERSQFALLFLLFLSPLARSQEALLSKSAAGWQPIEIRLAKPPSWHDHCLEITIKRVNHSKSRIFFTAYALRRLVVDASNHRILGASILASEGGLQVQTLGTMMLANQPDTLLKCAVYIHPTLAEDFFALMEDVKPAD